MSSTKVLKLPRRILLSTGFFFFFMLLCQQAVSQKKLPKDSLWKVWNDPASPDSSRLFAIGYLCSKYYWFSNIDSSMILTDLQYDYARKKNNRRYMAIALMKKSGSYAKKLDHNNSLLYALKALAIFREINYESGIASSLNNIGQDYMSLNQNEVAVTYFYKALGYFEKLGDKDRQSKAYSNIARLYAVMERYDSAASIFKRCLTLEKEMQNKHEISYICNSLAACYFEMNDTARTMQFLREALLLHKENNDPLGEAEALFLFGRVSRRRGDLNAASRYFNQSFDICKRHKINTSMSETLLALAELDTMHGADKEAMIKARWALRVIRGERSTEVQYRLNMLLERLLEKSGHYREALALHKRAIAERDSASIEKLKNVAYREQMKHDFERKGILAKAAHENQLSLLKAAAERHAFRQKIWLTISIALALVFLISGFFIYKYLRQKHTIATQKNHLLKQQLLVSQMNPHFIFNSLSAIQNFIFRQDSYQAGVYLKQFSELIRMILDFSTHDRITLDEEIHFLRTYLNLQKLRFNDRFDFEICIDPSLESGQDQVLVPPMLAQPFIENSIEHGIFYRSSGGFLSVKISASGNTLVYEIEDNGIGLEESQKINQQTRPQHRSLAIAITRERLESINAAHLVNREVKVMDRKEMQQDQEGVYVRFATPFFTV